LVTCDVVTAVGAETSVPVLVTDVQPVAVAVNVVAPVLDESAATVTGCGRFQLLESSVSVLPLVIDSPLLPDVATVTAIGSAGASVSDTPMSVVVPSGTLNVGGLIFRSSPDPQDPVGVGEGVGVVGDGDGDGLLVVDVPAVQVTVAGAVLVPL
jgi:hypothetical protein